MAVSVDLTIFDMIGVEFEIRQNRTEMRYAMSSADGTSRTIGREIQRPAPAEGGDPPPGEYYMTANEAAALTILRRMFKRRAAAIINDPSLEEPV